MNTLQARVSEPGQQPRAGAEGEPGEWEVGSGNGTETGLVKSSKSQP